MSRRSTKENYKRVAEKVVEQIKNNKKINVKRAMIECGYDDEYANSHGAQKVMKSNEFIQTTEGFLAKLRDLQADAMEIIAKKAPKATYRDGIEGIDKLKKLEYLTTGDKPTEAMQVSWKE